MAVKLIPVPIQKPEAISVILGQAHFIKTVEDVHEALVSAVPGIAFGLAFCEASGPCLVRGSGTDPELAALARTNAEAIGAGHSFLVFLRDAFPINVLPVIRQVPEVCGIYCATSNPIEVVVAETATGRGILGVVDGSPPKGVETESDVAARKALLRQLGYKL
jgi:adenosine/AMP kinase